MKNDLLTIKGARVEFKARLLDEKSDQAKDMLRRYLNATAKRVFDYYDNPSRKKIEIDDRLQFVCTDCGGERYKITGGNTSTFSAGWLVWANDTMYLIYETAKHRYAIPYNTVTRYAIESDLVHKTVSQDLKKAGLLK